MHLHGTTLKVLRDFGHESYEGRQAVVVGHRGAKVAVHIMGSAMLFYEFTPQELPEFFESSGQLELPFSGLPSLMGTA